MSVRVPDEFRHDGFDVTESSGLFVGISQFESPEFQDVPYAVDDAIDLAHLFVVELGLIAPQKTQLALSGRAKKAKSSERLRELRTLGVPVLEHAKRNPLYKLIGDQGVASGQRGIFVLVLATHGFSDEGAYLIASDTIRADVKETGINLSWTIDKVSLANAPRRIVLIDACRERLETESRRGIGMPMSKVLSDAIASAEGQAILMGATEGGYAYDDDERMNGVFTASIIDGLRGAATSDDGGFITIRGLSNYVNDQVRTWVKVHRPEHAETSTGIGMRLEGSAVDIPLAMSLKAVKTIENFLQRLPEYHKKLYENWGKVISAETLQLVREALDFAAENPEIIDDIADLRESVEALDGTVLTQRALAYIVNERRGELLRLMNPVGVLAPAAAKSGPRREVDDMTMVPIPKGTFMMGLTPEEYPSTGLDELLQREVPGHRVTLDAFLMDEHEVTNAQYARFVRGTQHPPPQTSAGQDDRNVWQGVNFPGGLDEHPVVNVSWRDANEYCGWAGRRLPTEAEWEFAARGGLAGEAYPWGSANACDARGGCRANVAGTLDGYEHESPVCTFGRLGYGLCDMAGNANEWAFDYYGKYSPSEATNPHGSDRGEDCVLRGGSYLYFPAKARVTSRSSGKPGTRRSWVGFRCARDARPEDSTAFAKVASGSDN